MKTDNILSRIRLVHWTLGCDREKQNSKDVVGWGCGWMTENLALTRFWSAEVDASGADAGGRAVPLNPQARASIWL